MNIARLFTNGKSQAIKLPKKYQFTGDDVYIKRVGEAVILFPKNKDWEVFLNGLNSFTDDLFKNGRGKNIKQRSRKKL
ncbi:MAG: type II toxin-antitoxin system VapB family antitoxin [Planctomycetaceae bacterium]|nr:type II toxin-antitoxin system VapB family antitoxin [Planctomycetaceae bacterium]